MGPKFDVLCSEARFDALGFSDVTCLKLEEKQLAVDCMDAALTAFLKEIGFQYCIIEKDTQLRKDLLTWSRESLESVCRSDSSILNATIEAGASCVEYFFPLAHHDTRLPMGKAMIATIAMDDNCSDPASKERLSRFQYDLWQGVQSQDGWSKMYMDVVKDFVKHFGAKDHRLGTIAGNSLANYAEVCSVEDRYAAKLPPHLTYVPPGIKANGCCPQGFPSYFRHQSGIPEPVVMGIFKPSREIEVPLDFWITSMTHLINFTNMINDLLSYGKELLAGETFNYISLETQAKRQANVPSQFPSARSSDGRWTVRDTVCEVLNETYKAKDALDLAFVRFAEYGFLATWIQMLMVY